MMEEGSCHLAVHTAADSAEYKTDLEEDPVAAFCTARQENDGGFEGLQLLSRKWCVI